MRLVHAQVILSAGILSQGKECVCLSVTVVVEETVITSSLLRNAMMPVLLLGVSIKRSCFSYFVSLVKKKPSDFKYGIFLLSLN
jgi:hypothetical protein